MLKRKFLDMDTNKNNNYNNHNNDNNHNDNNDNNNDNNNDSTLLNNSNYFTYKNKYNSDEILLRDNHIYFNSLINSNSITVLNSYCNYIITNRNLYNNNPIYLHINSKGGFLSSLLQFVEFKKICNYEIISIIENECNDCAIFLASICNYRIIRKNVVCKFMKYNFNSNYWYIFKQCDNDDENMYIKNILDELYNNIHHKITKEKFLIYLNQNNSWNSKKYRKLGLADEII